MRLALPLRELEQIERAFNVDVVRTGRCEFRPGGEQRGEMIDAIDLAYTRPALTTSSPASLVPANRVMWRRCAPPSWSTSTPMVRIRTPGHDEWLSRPD